MNGANGKSHEGRCIQEAEIGEHRASIRSLERRQAQIGQGQVRLFGRIEGFIADVATLAAQVRGLLDDQKELQAEQKKALETLAGLKGRVAVWSMVSAIIAAALMTWVFGKL